MFDLTFRVLDTAGLEDIRTKGSLAARTAAQTKRALEQTTVILFVVDARAGLTDEDKSVAREIRKTNKPVILLANKCEGPYLPAQFNELAGLGFGEPVAISATHGEGLREIYDALCEHGLTADAEPKEKPKRKKKVEKTVVVKLDENFEEIIEEEEEIKSLHIAIVGKPNAGKSTLINQLIGSERLLTGPEPGLTRDSIHIGWEWNGKPVRLVDTAGLRRRAKVTEHLEKMSGHETIRAIRLAHVVVLVIDAVEGVDKQDLVIARHVIEEGRALVIAVNKWDAVHERRAILTAIRERIEDSLAQAAGISIVTMSALKADGLDVLMKAVMSIYDVWNMRISTGKLNRWLEAMEADHPPPITAGRRIKLRYMTQIKSRPPTFSLWVNKPVDLPESYQRFLTHGLRETFGLKGVPIRWQLKKSENPYEDKARK